MSQNFYALLVGIDDYAHIGKLEGCVRDVRGVESYLKRSCEAKGLHPHIKTLKNSQAIKSRIVREFENHLGQAKEGDVALFYFAGHGGQEEAGKIFHDAEADDLLEIIICHDSTLEQSGMDISDKELRYLIRKVSENKPHLVTIFDCCFSGGNTRSIGIDSVKVRRLDLQKPQRKYTDFIFSQEIRESAFNVKSIEGLLPNGDHIHLAACGRDEEANEDPLRKKGLFTYLLIDTLEKSDGDISYHDLINQLRVKMDNAINKYQRQNVVMAPQHPEIYTQGNFAQIRFQKVLDGLLVDSEQMVQIHFDASDRIWQLNAGAIHGIKIGDEVIIENQGSVMKAKVRFVSPTISKIRFEGNSPIRDQILKGKVIDLRKASLKIFLKKFSTDSASILPMIHKLPAVEIVEESEKADYILTEESDQYQLLSSIQERPLIPPIIKGETLLSRLKELIPHIARWQHMRSLSTIGSRNNIRNSVEIQIGQTDARGRVRRFRPHNGIVKWNFREIDGELRIFFKVKLINKTDKPLFCSLVYLSQSFEVMPDLLEKSVTKIDPGEGNAVLAAGGQKLELRAPSFFVQNRWSQITSYLKLIIATEPFDMDMFRLASLHKSLAGRDVATESTRSLREQKWEVQTLVIEQIIPLVQ